MARPSADSAILAQLLALSPVARAQVEAIKARRKRGRPRKDDSKYRELFNMFRAYRRRHPDLLEEPAALKFLGDHPNHLRTLGLLVNPERADKKPTYGSLRNAVARGQREAVRARLSTTREILRKNGIVWFSGPLNLIDAAEGRSRKLVSAFDLECGRRIFAR